MPDFTFGPDGMILDDTTWCNPQTGDHFKVSGTYFENNNMVVQTTDGRTISIDQMSEYVQWDDKTPLPQNPATEQVPQAVLNEIHGTATDPNDAEYLDPEDAELIKGHTRVAQQPTATQPLRQPMVPDNNSIINKALSKTKRPNMHIDMRWPNFPEKQIVALVEVMDISLDDIAEYYMNDITNELASYLDDIKKQLTEYLRSKISVEEPTTKQTNKTVKTSKPAKVDKTTKTGEDKKTAHKTTKK